MAANGKKNQQMVAKCREMFPEFDMVCNLGQPMNQSFCNIATEFDFKPVNEELLYQSRLAFSLKKNRILALMKNRANLNIRHYENIGLYNQREFPKFHKQQAMII